MTNAQDIYNFIDIFAPFSTAMSFDNVGLLCGSEQAQSDTVLVTLDITPQVIAEAISMGAKIIISHHPVIFNPIKSLKSGSVPYLLAQNDITAICAHTNLDLAAAGVNTCLAKALDLKDIKLEDNEPIATGMLEYSMSVPPFAAYVKKKLNCTGVRYTNFDGEIQKVAVSSGAGGDSIYLAKKLGADVLVTGEIKHNYIIEARQIDIAVVDAGHYKTEDIVIQPLCTVLQNRFPEIDFVKSKAFTDYIEYM